MTSQQNNTTRVHTKHDRTESSEAVAVNPASLKLDLFSLNDENKLVISTDDIHDVHTPRDFEADDTILDSNDTSTATSSSADVTGARIDDVSLSSSVDVSELSIDVKMTSQVVMRSPKEESKRRGMCISLFALLFKLVTILKPKFTAADILTGCKFISHAEISFV